MLAAYLRSETICKAMLQALSDAVILSCSANARIKIIRLNWLMGFHCFIFLAAVLIKLQTLLFILKSTLDFGNRNDDIFCSQLLIFSLVRKSTVPWVAQCWRIAARQEKVGMPGMLFLLQTLKYTHKSSQTIQVFSVQWKIGESKNSSSWWSSLLSQVLKHIFLAF